MSLTKNEETLKRRLVRALRDSGLHLNQISLETRPTLGIVGITIVAGDREGEPGRHLLSRWDDQMRDTAR